MSDQQTNTTDRFWIQCPVGYDVEKVCSVGHPVVFKHRETGSRFTPLTLSGTLACIICIAIQTGLVCNRSHTAFEVGVVDDGFSE